MGDSAFQLVRSMIHKAEGRNRPLQEISQIPDPIIIGGFAVSVNEIVRGREYRFGDEQDYAPQRFKVLEPVRELVAVPSQAPVRVRELELA